MLLQGSVILKHIYITRIITSPIKHIPKNAFQSQPKSLGLYRFTYACIYYLDLYQIIQWISSYVIYNNNVDK